MKALFRKLIVAGLLSVPMVSAHAAGPVYLTWTFSDVTFDSLFLVNGTVIDCVGPSQFCSGTGTYGTIKSGSTLSFDAQGDIAAFDITTTAGTTSGTDFGYTYTNPDTPFSDDSYAPSASGNPVAGAFPQAWAFQSFDGFNILGVTFQDNGIAADPSNVAAAVPGKVLSVFGETTVEYDLDPSKPAVVYRSIYASNGTITLTRVPEPASIALFGTALLGLGFIARRRNRNDA